MRRERIVNARAENRGLIVRTERRGFTLFELTLATALLVIAGAMVMPSVSSLWGNTPINAAADSVKARMAEARARAIRDNRPYRFDVQDNSGTMRVAPDSPEFWDGSGGDPSMMTSTDSSAPPPLVVEDTLPREIRFSGSQTFGPDGQPQASGGGNWVCPVVFLPNGTTRQDAQIAFTEAGGRQLVLKVQSTTGAVTVSP
jgi:Tfp pilus assembly protein FimT